MQIKPDRTNGEIEKGSDHAMGQGIGEVTDRGYRVSEDEDRCRPRKQPHGSARPPGRPQEKTLHDRRAMVLARRTGGHETHPEREILSQEMGQTRQ